MKEFLSALLIVLVAILIMAPNPIGPVPPDNTPYNAGTWNGNQRAATKNAIRDQLEAMAAVAAPTNASYITQIAEANLTNEQAMGALGTGAVWNTTTTGVQSISAALTSIGNLTETNGGLLYGTADNTYAWLAAGATTEILVGGGAAAPVWTTATGSGAPVRATDPTFANKVMINTATTTYQLNVGGHIYPVDSHVLFTTGRGVLDASSATYGLKPRNGSNEVEILTNNTSAVTVDNAQVMTITSFAGSGDVTTNAAKEMIDTSDRRLKKHLGYLEDGALDKVMKFRPVYFAYLSDLAKVGKKSGKKRITKRQARTLGFYAQDVRPIQPEAAPYNKKEDKWGFNSRAMLAVMAKAIQELNAKVAELEKDRRGR